MEVNNNMKEVYIIVNNHFDLMWRRCFRDELIFQGKIFVSYSRLQAGYILENIKLAQNYPNYKFQIESVYILREFLKDYPQEYEYLKSLVLEGRLYIPASGECIIDSNMVLGESIIRNYLLGLTWLQNYMGYRPKVANRTDAFGNCAQLPQILKGCGVDVVTGINYSENDGVYWRGLDKSTVVCNPIPVVGSSGGWRKYAPCMECNGEGNVGYSTCTSCNGMGINRQKAEKDWNTPVINDDAFGQWDCGIMVVGGEELMPNEHIIEWLQDNKIYNATFSNEECILTKIDKFINNLEEPEQSLVHSSPELNPNNTGCYTTRILTKQTCRRQEYALLSAEILCLAAALSGAKYPINTIRNIWRDMCFTFFHDAITGTHVNAASLELEKYWRTIDAETQNIRDAALKVIVKQESGCYSVINPSGFEVSDIVTINCSKQVPQPTFIYENGEEVKVLEYIKQSREVKLLIENIKPFSARPIKECGVYSAQSDTCIRFNWEEAETFTLGSNILQGEIQKVAAKNNDNGLKVSIENSRFMVLADKNGVISVYDKKLNYEIMKENKYRPFELILENDIGSPWATISKDTEQVQLSQFTVLVSKEKFSGMKRLNFEVNAPQRSGAAIDGVHISYSVTIYEGIDRIEFSSKVKWDCYNQRLRIAFPLCIKGKHKYEIPYGILERAPYEPSFNWIGANGDWPAINWAGVENEAISVGILNKGTPSYKIEAGQKSDTVMVSLLRSPTLPTYLHEPDAYNMNDWDCMRDAGLHEFELGVVAYGTSFEDSDIVPDAHKYNCMLSAAEGKIEMPKFPVAFAKNAYVASMKYAERQNAFILRFVEYRGHQGEVRVKLPEYISYAEITDIMEEPIQKLDISNNEVLFKMRPFEIKTISLLAN